MFRGTKQPTRSRRFFLGIFCLLIVVIVSSIFFILKGNGDGLSVNHHQSGTAVVPSPTLTSSIAASPTPFFAEDFTDSSKNWFLSKGSSNSDYTRTRSDSQLTLSVTNHKLLVESVPANVTIFSDFMLKMTFTFVKGDENDSAGLYLRGDSNLDHDYRVDIFGDKTVSVGKEALSTQNVDENIALVNRAYVSQLQRDKPNTLMLIMKGNQLELSINQKLVGTVADSDYQAGQISLFVQNGSTSNRATVSISSILIEPAPLLPLTPVATP